MIISDSFNGTPSGFNNNCEDEKEIPIGIFIKQTKRYLKGY